MKNKTLQSLERVYAQDFLAETQRFNPSGMTHDGSIPDNRSDVIPEPNELKVESDDTITTIVRHLANGECVPVAACARTHASDTRFPGTLGDSVFHAHRWLNVYRFVSRPKRAEMLNIDDPMHLSSQDVADALGRNSTPGYKSKMRTVATADTSGVIKVEHIVVRDPGVSHMANPASGRKRVSWNGYSGFSLARWMGAQGWTNEQAVHVFKAIDLPLGKSAIIGGVYAGRSNSRGAPASVTPEHARYLKALCPLPDDSDPTAPTSTTITTNPTKPTIGERITPTLSKHLQKVDADFRRLQARQARRK